MNITISPSKVPELWISADLPCGGTFQIYKIVTGTPIAPETIIINYCDYTFRKLQKGDYTVV